METEDDSDKQLPPRKQGYEEVLKAVSSSFPNDFFVFDMNGYEYIKSKNVPPIPTFLPILVSCSDLDWWIATTGGIQSSWICRQVWVWKEHCRIMVWFKTKMSYYVVASVVCPSEVGGMQSPVAFFDVDRKLDVSVLTSLILQRLSSVGDDGKRSILFKEALSRVMIYRPKDLTHFALLLFSIQNSGFKPRLFVLDSLSAYLYDLGNNEAQRTLFHSILEQFRIVLREKQASLLILSPSSIKVLE